MPEMGVDRNGVARAERSIGAYEYGTIPEVPIVKMVMVLLSQFLFWILLPIVFSIVLLEGYFIWRMKLIIKNHEVRIRFFESGGNFEAWYELHKYLEGPR